MKPQIATILDNGEYGQRDMTDQEISELEKLAEEMKKQNDIEQPA